MADNFLDLFTEAWRPLDPDLRTVLAIIYKRLQGTKTLPQMTPVEARAAVAGMIRYFAAGAPAVPHVDERTIAGASGPIRVRLYDPGVPAPAPAALFIHGGGWVICDIDLYDGVARQIATHAGLRVVSVDYGRAPEHPFPVPLNDCIAAVRWLAGDGAAAFGLDPKRLALIGDSAGANLALATCIALRDAGASPVRGAALIYGCYSRDTDTASCRAYGSGAYFMTTADMQWYWTHYLRNPADASNPLVAPLYANLRGLPPLYVAAAEYDVLRDDSTRLVERLKADNLAVEDRLWKGMIHVSLSLAGWIDALGPELDRIGAFLRRVTAA